MELIKILAYQSKDGYQQAMVDGAVETEIGYIGHPGLHWSEKSETFWVSYWKSGFCHDTYFKMDEEPFFSIGLHDDHTSRKANAKDLEYAEIVIKFFQEGFEQNKFEVFTSLYPEEERGDEVFRELLEKARCYTEMRH